MTNAKDLIKQLDTSNWTDIYKIESILNSKKYKFKKVFPILKETFISSSHWQCRKFILFHLLNYSRQFDEIVDLAIFAFKDKSTKVILDACAICAFALDERAVPFLHDLKEHKNKEVANASMAAIKAIKYKNHELLLNPDWKEGKNILIHWEVPEGKNFV